MSDLVHKRPGTAGNKSFLTHRQERGIVGYTGYNPSSGAVPVPTKIIVGHVGKLLSPAQKDAALLAPANTHLKSNYNDGYATGDPRPYSALRTETLFQQQSKSPVAGAVFRGASTKQREIDASGETAQAQFDATEGLRFTVVNLEAARVRRCFSAAPRMQAATMQAAAAAAPPTALDLDFSHATRTDNGTFQLHNGDYAGYRTTNDRMNMFQVPHDARPRPVTALPLRRAELPIAAVATVEGNTTYKKAYGVEFSDPNSRVPTTLRADQLKLAASTRELQEGTPADGHHLSSYMGFVPQSKVNAHAVKHGEAEHTRVDAKIAMVPLALDQYSRSRLPGTSTFKPQAVPNVTIVMPSQGPSGATNSGAAAKGGLQFPFHQKDRTNFVNSNVGIMDFFTRPGENDPEMGSARAQSFYYQVRPLEGSIVRTVPAERTPYGNVWAKSYISAKPPSENQASIKAMTQKSP